MFDQSNQSNPNTISPSYSDLYQPPKIMVAQKPSSKKNSETLEDQNIFFLLGVEDGTPEEKEQFLDELQQVIWEDFLENDLELLVTEAEYVKVSNILAGNKSEIEKQDDIVAYLEEIIPDLEEIMLEKALELKEEMVMERVTGMKEYFAGNQSNLDKVTKAKHNFVLQKWHAGAQMLNSLR